MATLAALAIFLTISAIWFLGVPALIGRVFKLHHDTIAAIAAAWFIPAILIMLSAIMYVDSNF